MQNRRGGNITTTPNRPAWRVVCDYHYPSLKSKALSGFISGSGNANSQRRKSLPGNPHAPRSLKVQPKDGYYSVPDSSVSWIWGRVLGSCILFIGLSGGGPRYWEGRTERYLHSTTLRTLGMQETGQKSTRGRMVEDGSHHGVR